MLSRAAFLHSAGAGALGTLAFGRTASAADVLDGGAELNASEFDKAPGAIAPAYMRALSSWRAPETLPEAYTVPDMLPISTQGSAKHLGSPGSCEAQSFGYGLGGYAASRRFDGSSRWDVNDESNLPSPAWLYSYQHALRHKACPTGSGATQYLQQLTAAGAPSVKEVPYEPVCSYLDPLGSQAVTNYPDAKRIRIGSFATFKIPAGNREQRLAFMKGYLAAGHPIAFSGPVAKGYGKPQTTDGVFYAPQGFPGGGHGQVIVGYDDMRGSEGHRGAFLVQNSFGKDWGEEGRLWWAYETLLGSQKFAAVAFPIAEPPASGFVLEARAGTNGAHDALVVAMALGEPVDVDAFVATGPAGHAFHHRYHAPFDSGVLAFTMSGPPNRGRWQMEISGRAIDGSSYSKRGEFDVA